MIEGALTGAGQVINYDTRAYPQNRLDDACKQIMNEVFMPRWNVEYDDASSFYIQGFARSFGDFIVSHSQVSFNTLVHVPKATPSTNYVTAHLATCAQAIVIDDRTVVTKAGDIVVLSDRQPCIIRNSVDYTTTGISFPIDLLKRHVPDASSIIGRHFSTNALLGAQVSSLLDALPQLHTGLCASDTMTKVANHLLGLLAACHSLDRPQDEPSTRHKADNLNRIIAHIEQSLPNPGLGIEYLAAHFRVSERYIQKLFANYGETASAYIRRRRLEECRNELLDMNWRWKSITQIAFDWGFSGSSHFARAFKDHFGVSAREMRAAMARKN